MDSNSLASHGPQVAGLVKALLPFGVLVGAVVLSYAGSRLSGRQPISKPDPAEVIDVGRLKARAARRNEWDTARTDHAFAEYIEFLGMVQAEPWKPFAPLSDDMDAAWHEHLLDTERYDQDCRRLLGRKLHHLPTDEENRGHVARAASNTAAARRSVGGRDRRRHGARNNSSGGDCSTGIAVVQCSGSSPTGASDCHHGDGGHGGSSGGHSCGGHSCGTSCGGH